MSGRAKRRRQRTAEAAMALTTRRAPEAIDPALHRRDLVCRDMQVRAATINEADRSVEVVMATERATPVFDMQAFRVIDEVLLVRGVEHAAQVVLLDTHFRFSVDDVLGSTREIRAEGEQVIGRAYFADDDDSVRTWNKVKAGHITDVSVGYRAKEFVDIPPGRSQVVAGKRYTAGERTLRITTRWEIRELSVVPIGADQAAKFRSDDPPHLESVMNPQLRAYLESLGLRTDADDATAWRFFDNLGGTARTAAVALHNTDPQGRVAIPSPNVGQGQANRVSIPENGSVAMNNIAAALIEQHEARGRRLDAEEANLPPAERAEALIRQQARDEERARVHTLREMAGTDVPAETLNRAIDEGWNTDRAGREFLNAVRGNRTEPVGGNTATPPRAPAGHVRDRSQAQNTRSFAAAVAQFCGVTPVGLEMRGLRDENEQPMVLAERDADLGNRYRFRHAMDILAAGLELRGVRHNHLDEDEFLREAFTTLAINAVFTTNVYARIVEGYTNTPDTTAWCQSEELANFMVHPDITMGKLGSPKLLARGGEAESGTLDTGSENFRVLRYALKITLPEEDFIDDRLGAIMGTIPSELGETFAELRPDLVYATLLSNPTLLKDSTAVFHANHSNTATNALTRANLQAGEVAMANQRVSGRAVNNAPKFLLVPTDLRHTATSLLQSDNIFITGDTNAEQGNFNPVKTLGLSPIVEPRVNLAGVYDPLNAVTRAGSATNWWLFSNRRTIKVVTRRGTGGRPVMRQFQLDKGVWGLGWDVKHDIGCGFSDFVGSYRGNT